MGSATVLADDPQLTVRRPDGRAHPRRPVRIVFDRRLRTPAGSRLATDGAAPSWIVTAPDADRTDSQPAPVGCELIAAAPGPGFLAAALAELHARGIRSLLVEGGATLAGALLADRLVDRIVWYTAPRLLGADGAPAVRGLDVPTCALAPGFRVVGARRIGDDLRLVLEPDLTAKEGP